MTMRYMHILLACAAEPWALEKSKLIAIANFLKFKASGGEYTAEEVARITQKREKEVIKGDGSIGILPIHGVIGERMNLLDDISGGVSSELITSQFRAMLNDATIKAIILDINSPGGVARSIEEIAGEIYQSRGIKPIVAQVNTCAASAAYWIATQADEVIVTPSGQVGSIGVYTIHEDISKMLEMEGIKETLIYSGQYKVLGNELEPLGDDAKAVFQTRVDQLASSFVRGVARGRGVSLATVNEQFGQGLMFSAADAVQRGMADRIASMSETLERFGVQMNPALVRQRGKASALIPATETLATKLRAGDQPTVREWENGLKGLGLSNSEAERAVRVCFKDKAQGEPEKTETDRTAVAAGLAEFRQQLDSFTLPPI